MGSGGEGVVAVFVSELFFTGTIGRYVRRQFRGVHSVHCLTRDDITVYAGSTQLQYIRWRQADRVEVRFKGHKGDQE